MFERKPLRDDVQQEILARLWDGRLPPAQRINETHLSAEMGVSRTPLREAMIYLAAAGFLDSDLGRGFKTPPLEIASFRRIQDVLRALVPTALDTAEMLAPEQLMELSNLLGRARMHSADQADCARLEHAFLAGVLRSQANELLVADILRLAGLARRYWHAAGSKIDAAAHVDSLGSVYEALRTQQHEQAADLWQAHHDRFTTSVITALG